jgi:hypothetical protein
MSGFIGNLLNGIGLGALAQQGATIDVPGSNPPAMPVPQATVPVEFDIHDAAAAANAPIPTPVTPISQSAFKSQLAGFIAPNPLNAYFNPTYHFRLFMAGDKDLISQQGGAQTISDLLLKVNNQIDKVIIAETGVTGFNIKDVQIDTVNAQTAETRQQTATTLTMTIVEPLGISFLDGMAGAGQMLGVWDYTKMIYFLQLWFEGYTETGTPVTPIPHPPFQQPANSSTTRSNGGQWLWALKLTTVDTQVNEGGGVYTLHFISTESELMFVEAAAYAPKKAIRVNGATVADLLNNYAAALSAGSIEEQGQDGQGNGLSKFLIDSSQTIQFGVAKGKTPGQFKLQPALPDYNSVRIRQQGPVYNMVVPVGTTLNDLIVSVVLSTEEGQAMFKDELISQSDQITAKLYRTPVHISLEADVMITKYDQGPTRNYQQTVTVHLVPHYSQTSVLSTDDLNNATNPSAQRQRILELATLGFLRKQYDFLFTGLNTEVLEFDIKFNFAWQAVLPKQGGTHSDYNTEATQCRLNRNIDNTLPPLQTVDTKSSTIGATPQTYYIEDILPQLNGQTNIGKVLPVSFVTTLYDTEREAGIGSQGQSHAAEPLASAIVSQKYYGAFMQIDITIRGDPYWLGQTNMERQVIFRNGGAAFDTNSLSDFSSGNPTFVLNLKYPVTIGDDFVPVLKDSAVFNGLYEVTRVKHTFSEGAFKQVLSANRLTQLDPSLAFMADTNTLNNDTSSAATPQSTPSGAAGMPSTGLIPGVA